MPRMEFPGQDDSQDGRRDYRDRDRGGGSTHVSVSGGKGLWDVGDTTAKGVFSKIRGFTELLVVLFVIAGFAFAFMFVFKIYPDQQEQSHRHRMEMQDKFDASLKETNEIQRNTQHDLSTVFQHTVESLMDKNRRDLRKDQDEFERKMSKVQQD